MRCIFTVVAVRGGASSTGHKRSQGESVTEEEVSLLDFILLPCCLTHRVVSW